MKPLALHFLLAILIHAQVPEEKTEPSSRATTPALEDDGSRVSVLGYHVLDPQLPPTQMRIRTDKFREQMQRVKDSGIPVISLAQFLAWRSGEATLPPQSILLTLDDGWKSVHTEAFPIFKELGLPFTIYLYKDYVDGGGRALTIAQIKEMQASGLCTIGCHSTSHPFPGTVKKFARQGPEAFAAFLQKEMADSKTFLEEKFGQPVTTYAYPGGYHTPEMHELADQLGYQQLFTVIPGKVRRDSDPHALNRYIVLGDNDGAFEAALVFRNNSFAASPDGSLALPTTPYPVNPPAGSLIESRLPEISVDLRNLQDLDPASLVMRVGGFGKVPATYDPATKSFFWTVNRPLRQPTCLVSVQWKTPGSTKSSTPMTWTFRLDHTASYLAR